MSSEPPDFLKRRGIVAVRDNLDGRQISAPPDLLALLFGADFIGAKPPKNEQLPESHHEPLSDRT